MRARFVFLISFALAAAVARADQTVTVGPGLSFSPSTVTVAPGEQVIWNFASGPHTTTSDATSGPEIWDSGIQFSGTFSHTFTTPGTYPYHCSVHSFAGGTMMNGVVQVAAVTDTPTPTLTPSSPPTTTPTPTSTSVPTATATAVAAPTPTPTPAGAGVAVPDLGLPGRFVLAAILAAVALYLLLTRSR